MNPEEPLAQNKVDDGPAVNTLVSSPELQASGPHENPTRQNADDANTATAGLENPLKARSNFQRALAGSPVHERPHGLTGELERPTGQRARRIASPEAEQAALTTARQQTAIHEQQPSLMNRFGQVFTGHSKGSSNIRHDGPTGEDINAPQREHLVKKAQTHQAQSVPPSQNTPRVRHWGQANDAEYNRLMRENRMLRERASQFQDDLRKERALVRRLKDQVGEQEHVITNLHTKSINLLSRDVSSRLPDDRIRRDFKVFFDRDALGWCMDHYTTTQINQPGAVETLISDGILANSAAVPDHLRISMQSEATAAILLQAALARALCDMFLKEPFFLQGWLPSTDIEALRQTRDDLVTTWRVRTCEFLEAAFPPSSQFFEERAGRFAAQYAYLMRPLDEGSLDELAELMESFARLTMQLWKRNAIIQVEGLNWPGLETFHSAQTDMELHASALDGTGGAQLDGRPIQVMIRPRIVSFPVQEGGQRAGRVVWSNAVVWVSNALTEV